MEILNKLHCPQCHQVIAEVGDNISGKLKLVCKNKMQVGEKKVKCRKVVEYDFL